MVVVEIKKLEVFMETKKIVKEEKSVFNTLNAINVNEHVEKKNGLSYLAWAYAWAEVKKIYPDASYTIYETTNPEGYICNYFTDGRTCWVKTGVTINGLEHIEELPVMDIRNKSIPLNALTSFDVNKSIQRSLTKAVARHGLGLYIYAGEDLPEDSNTADSAEKTNGGKLEGENKTENAVKPITNAQIKRIMDLKIIVANVLKRYNVKDLTMLTEEQAAEIIKIKEKALGLTN